MKRLGFPLLVMAAWFLVGAVSAAADTDQLGKVEIGGVVPPYRLTAVDGRLIDKERNKGRVIVMVCLVPEQQDSIQTAAEADRLVGRYDTRDVGLVVLSSEEIQKTEFGKFWLRSGITVPLVLDRGRSIHEDFGLREYPTTIIINAKGRLAHVISGKEAAYFPLLDIYVRHAMGKIDEKSMRQELKLRNFDTEPGPRGVYSDGLRRLKTGAPMPPFQLKTAAGKVIDNGGLAGKVVVMVYVSAGQRNSDAACVDANHVVRQLARDDLQLVFVTADVGGQEHFSKVWSEAALSVPLAFDEGRRLYGRLGLMVFPTTLLIDQTGRLRHVISTRRSDYARVLDAYARHTLGILDDAGLQEWLKVKPLEHGSPKSLALRHRSVARQLRNEGQLESAERELRVAIGLEPANVQIQLDLADLCLKIESTDECLEIVEAVLQKDPRHRHAMLLQGIGLFQKDRLDEAEAVLLEALQVNPDPARAHFYLGRIYELRGEKDPAIEHYREAASRLLDE